MLLRGQQVSATRLLVDLILCACGIAIIVFAVYLWRDYGFTLGPNHLLHPTAPDPSGHARWLLLVGVGIAGYFGFSLASTFVQTDSKEDHHDATPHI